MAFQGTEERIEEEVEEEEEVDQEEWKQKLKDIVEAPTEEKLKGGPASRAFTMYLKTWNGNKLVENYAKCWHLAKNLSGKPQTDKFKLLKQAVEHKEELREAIAEGLVPAPMELGDLPDNERQARNYETRKKKKRRKGRGKGTNLKREKGV